MKSNYLRVSLFFLAYLLISAVLFFYFDMDKKNRISVYLNQQIEKLSSEFKATKNAYEKLSNFVYDQLSNDKDFLAVLSSNQKDQIYNYLLPYYKILKRYNIHYLTIQKPDGTVVINMHKPYKKEKKTKQDLFSTEKSSGKIVMEFTKPIYIKGKLLVFFKTAISYNTLKKELQRLFRGKYEYILNNSLITKNVFNYGNYLFIQSDLHPKFYYEENSAKERASKERELIHKINLSIKEKVKQRLGQGKNFAVLTEVDGKYYIVTFLAINSSGYNIGYLISYKQDDMAAAFDMLFLQNIIFSNILIIILLAFIYYFFQTKFKFEEMAVIDKLTKLYNRHKFYEIAEQEMVRSKRHNRPFSLVLFDIDHFKQINDTYGHDVGDYVLATMAKIIKDKIRKYDYIFRWGGEEFIILAPETELKNAHKLAEKIRKLVEEHSFDKVGKVTISLGAAQFYPDSDKDIDQVIKRADTALYQSKREGRNRTTILF